MTAATGWQPNCIIIIIIIIIIIMLGALLFTSVSRDLEGI
jgi:hypothetical protein